MKFKFTNRGADYSESRNLSMQLPCRDDFSLWHNKQLHSLNLAEKYSRIMAGVLVLLLLTCAMAWLLWRAA